MVFNKWEGKGIGMATLVNLCLQNEIDLPYYLLSEEEIRLFMCAGRLMDDQMEAWFRSFDGYIENKLNGREMTDEQKRILAYLMKSEWANRQLRYTIILTQDNNHFTQLASLEEAGLISRHPNSPPMHPIYIADRALMKEDYTGDLRALLGEMAFDPLKPQHKDVLSVLYRFNHFSKQRWASARQTALSLWWKQPERGVEAIAFESFYRKIKYAFKQLEALGFIRRDGKYPRYEVVSARSSAPFLTSDPNRK